MNTPLELEAPELTMDISLRPHFRIAGYSSLAENKCRKFEITVFPMHGRSAQPFTRRLKGFSVTGQFTVVSTKVHRDPIHSMDVKIRVHSGREVPRSTLEAVGAIADRLLG